MTRAENIVAAIAVLLADACVLMVDVDADVDAPIEVRPEIDACEALRLDGGADSGLTSCELDDDCELGAICICQQCRKAWR